MHIYIKEKMDNYIHLKEWNRRNKNEHCYDYTLVNRVGRLNMHVPL